MLARRPLPAAAAATAGGRAAVTTTTSTNRMSLAQNTQDARRKLQQAYRCVFVGLPVFILFTVALSLLFNYATAPHPLPPLRPLNATVVDPLDTRWPAALMESAHLPSSTPMLVHGSFITQWSALRRYSLAALAERSFYINHMYQSTHPVWRPLELGSLLETKMAVPVGTPLPPVPASDLPALMNSSYVVWEGPLADLAPSEEVALDSVQPLAPLQFLLVPDDAPSGHIHAVRAQLLGKGHLVDLHYHETTRFICQLSGRVTVSLYPPSDWPLLSLHPSFHPLHRFTQVSLFTWDHLRFANFRRAHGMVADLRPGDILFVPPFWVFAMRAHDASVSAFVSTVKPDAPTAADDRRSGHATTAAADTVHLPFSPVLSKTIQKSVIRSSRTRGSLYSYLARILHLCLPYTDERSAPNFVYRLLLTRYGGLSRGVSRIFVKLSTVTADLPDSDRPLGEGITHSYACSPLLGDTILHTVAEWVLTSTGPIVDGAILPPPSSSTLSAGMAAFNRDDLSEADRERFEESSITHQRTIEALVESIHANATAVCATLSDIANPHVATIVLQDYVERVIGSTLGLEHIPAYLHKCFVEPHKTRQ